MKIALTDVINPLTGTSIELDGKPLNVIDVCLRALFEEKEVPPPQERINKFRLCKILSEKNPGDMLELQNPQLGVLLKKAIEQCTSYNSIVIGQILIAMEDPGV